MIVIGINGYKSFIAANFLKKYKKKYKIKHFKGDINNIDEFKVFTKKSKFTYFIHFAGLSRQKCSSNKDHCLKINYIATKKTIDFLNTLKLKPVFIFISSSHVYDKSKYKLNENSTVKPSGLYGKLKLKSENYIKKNYEKHSILRLFNVYGKNQPASFFISDMINKIKNKQTITIDNSVKDFIDVNEVSKIINFIITKKILTTINVASGHGVSLLNVIKNISKKINIKPLVVQNKASNKVLADISLLKFLGYKNKKNEKYFNI